MEGFNLLWLFAVVLTAAKFTAATVIDVNCSTDDDATNQQLDSCLQQGQQFAELFEKAVKKNRIFEHCSEYAAFGDCLRPLLQKCERINRTIPHKWKTIVETMDNFCKPKCSNCSAPLSCMMDQYQSIYSQLCREMFAYNKEQNTHSKCRWLRDKLDCEQSLIASACGESAGNLYLALVKVNIKKEKCFVPHSSHNRTKHFKYSSECPVNLTKSISRCTEHYPHETILQFRKENQLIVDGKKKDVKNSCIHYNKYKHCEDELSNTCPVGVHKIMHFSGEQRIYQLKMDFICKEKRKAYLTSLYCYQNVSQTANFTSCNKAWKILEKKLSKVTAYQYYCLPKHPDVTSVLKYLKEFRACYEDVIRGQCGDIAATTMGQFIKKALNDPMSLKWKYYPDCDVHHPDSRYTSTQSTTLSTTLSATQSPRLSTSSQKTLLNNRINKHHNTVSPKRSVTSGSRSLTMTPPWTILAVTSLLCVFSLRTFS